MHAYSLHSFGLETLAPSDLPEPVVAPGKVIVRVHAVSLNFRDLLVVKGLYNPKMQLPRIPCSDGAGEVVAIGEGVTRVKRGDRVCGIFMQRWTDGPATAETNKAALGGDVDGMLAELVMLDESGVVKFPDHLSYEEASTLPCAAVTAWNALHHAGLPSNPITSGDTVLIQGTGGVSIFALQFAKLAGARVLGTSSSDEKLARAKSLGLDAGFNYRGNTGSAGPPDWAKWAISETGEIGPTRIIEVGGSGTLAQSLRAIAVGGMVAQIGVLSGGAASEGFAIGPLLHKQIRLQGIYVGSRTMFEEMNAAISAAKLHPVVDQVFDFDDALAAFRTMETGSHFGKIVIGVPK
jgi:NADPH:quinone reductase-like Zn-dependent oxidoreductase